MHEHTREKLAHWIARHLPKRVIYWAAVHVAAYATMGKYGDTVVPELGALEAYDRFGTDFGVQ